MLSFMDDYWKVVGSEQTTSDIRQNKHFASLTSLLMTYGGNGIAEAKIPARYRPWKKWDLCFPQTGVAIEYKSVTSKSIEKCKYLRIEEAVGSAYDVRAANSDLRMGFLLLFAFNRIDKKIIKSRDYMIDTFSEMVKDGLYDFFCPLQSTGIGQHEELSTEHTFENFLTNISQGHTNARPIQRSGAKHSTDQEGVLLFGEREGIYALCR